MLCQILRLFSIALLQYLPYEPFYETVTLKAISTSDDTLRLTVTDLKHDCVFYTDFSALFQIMTIPKKVRVIQTLIQRLRHVIVPVCYISFGILKSY